MAITYQRGTTGSTTLGADINVDITSDTPGDLIFVAVRVSGSTPPTAPPGWNVIASDTQGSTRSFILAWHVKQEGDTTFTFIVPGASTSSWLLDVFRGGVYVQISTATNQPTSGNTIGFDPLTLSAGSASYLVATWTNSGGAIVTETGYTSGQLGTQVQSLYKLNMSAGFWDPPDATLSNSTQQNRIGWQVEIGLPGLTYASFSSQMDAVGSFGPTAQLGKNLAATIAGASVIAETAEYDLNVEASLSGTSNVGPSSYFVAELASGIPGVFTGAGAAQLDQYAVVSLAGAGALASGAEYRLGISTALAGAGSLLPTVQIGAMLSALLAGDGSLIAAQADLEARLATAISAFGELDMESTGDSVLAADIHGAGQVSAEADYRALLASSQSGVGSLSTHGTFQASLGVLVSGSSTFNAFDPKLERVLAAAVTGAGSLSASATIAKVFALALIGSGAVAAQLHRDASLGVGIAGGSDLADQLEHDVLLGMSLLVSGDMSAQAAQGYVAALIAGASGLTADAEYYLEMSSGINGSGGILPLLGDLPIEGIRTGRIRTSDSIGWIESAEGGYVERAASGRAII